MLNKFIKLVSFIIAQRSWSAKRNYLIKRGAVIGEGTRLNCRTSSFGTEPYLIEVGDDCLFAKGIELITHDGGIKVLNSLNYFNGAKMDKMGRIKIGNNVYMGMGVHVMPGIVIGNNVIIGAKALVTHDIPDNSVAVGIPAKVIGTIDEYYEKALSRDNLYATGKMNAQEKRKYLEKNVK